MADDSEQIGQDEIEALLRQAQGGAAPTPPPEADAAPPADGLGLGQGDIEALLNQQSPAAATPQPPVAAPPQPTAATPSPAQAESAVGQNDIDLLLNQAEQALASINEPADALPAGVSTFEFKDFVGSPASTETATLDLMRDVQLDVKIELGRTEMHLEEVLKLKKGAVVPLDKLAGDPVDIYVNGRLIARGEVLVLNDNFCVRVAELIVGESAVA